MDELRVLVVGGGARGSALAHAWAATDGARVTAVVDPDTDRARALAAEVGAETVAGDYREAIPASDADVVVAATPTFLHRPIAELAAGEGRHVLSEKPIALTLDDADAILAAVARAGVAIDTASCVVEFESGDIWGCNISWGLPPGVQRPGFEDVLGRHGVLTFDQRLVTLQRRGGETEVYDGLDAPLDQRVCADFAAAVRAGREPKVTGPAAREALRGCLELLASIERGETVTR